MTTFALEGPKWSIPVVTWAFAAPVTGVFSSTITGAYALLVQSAFARWDDVINIGFQLINTPATADIIIGFTDFGATNGQVGETDYSYGGTSLNFFPGIKIRVEDLAERPAPVVNGAATYQGTQATLNQVVLHEIGHALGLNHDSDPAALMYTQASSINRDIGPSDLAGIHQLYAAPSFSQTNTVTGNATHPDGELYSGPVSYLTRQYIYDGPDAVAMSTNQANVFLKGGAKDDALTVVSGQNVLDGGTGSNFLTGGTGTDEFYVDGRGGQVSWGTLVNFHAGDKATFWGFDPAISTRYWSATAEGAGGYQGATMHANLFGTGTNASITFAGLTQAQVDQFTITTGRIGTDVYLQIVAPTPAPVSFSFGGSFEQLVPPPMSLIILPV